MLSVPEHLFSKNSRREVVPLNAPEEQRLLLQTSSNSPDVKIIKPLRTPWKEYCPSFTQVVSGLTLQGQATGAMSWAFREALLRKPQQSYHELLVNVRELLAGKYQQKPVLSASHPIDTKLLFII